MEKVSLKWGHTDEESDELASNAKKKKLEENILKILWWMQLQFTKLFVV